MRRLSQAALVLLLFLVVALAAALVTMRLAIHGAEVVVPNLRGMSMADATKRSTALDLTVVNGERYYSPAVPAGRVLSQFPAPGTTVRRGWRLRVTESLGPQTTAVPRTLGQDERMAEMEARRLGLHVSTIAHMPYAAQPADTVMAQTPTAGAADAQQPNISLLLSTAAAAEATAYVMPDLRNRPATAASAAIAHAGLKLAPFIYQDAHVSAVGALTGANATAAPLAPVVRGTVIAQMPAPGKRVDETTPVVLTVVR